MSEHINFRSALILCVLMAAVIDGGPLASPAVAQRSDEDDERRSDDRRGDREGGENRDWRRGRGRGGWGRSRGNDENQGDRRDRGPERNRDDSEGRGSDDNDDSESGVDVTGWARDLVKQNDKNGDMMLQEDERGKLRGPAASADLDGDKVITVEEIVRSLSQRQRPGRGGRDGQRRPGRESGGGTSGGAATDKSEPTAKKRVYTSLAAAGAGDAKEADKRRSYRFTPATERLMGDLPSWFKSRDRNKDGQVSMSEYSRSWTDRLVREFQRYDRNDDGVVTPKEVAE